VVGAAIKKSNFACVLWEILSNMTQVSDAVPKSLVLKESNLLKNQYYFGTVPYWR
jgi:hypothetical protein